MKSLGEEKAAGTVAGEALVQIQNIYHTDNLLQKLPPAERRKRRKTLVKPLVDSFFHWCSESLNSSAVIGNSKRDSILLKSGEILTGLSQRSTNTIGQ